MSSTVRIAVLRFLRGVVVGVGAATLGYLLIAGGTLGDIALVVAVCAGLLLWPRVHRARVRVDHGVELRLEKSSDPDRERLIALFLHQHPGARLLDPKTTSVQLREDEATAEASPEPAAPPSPEFDAPAELSTDDATRPVPYWLQVTGTASGIVTGGVGALAGLIALFKG
jgi:hypothetical protein